MGEIFPSSLPKEYWGNTELYIEKNGGKWEQRQSCCLMLICVGLFATPWTVACQAPLSMGFPRQEYWSGLPSPLPGDLPDPGIKPMFPALQVYSSR